MSSEAIKLSIKRVFTDRPFLTLAAAVVIVGVIYCLVLGLTVQPRDVQVYSRYTAFGEAHFYKNYWYYLISFIIFGAVVTVSHVALMVKLHNLERRQTAFVIGYMALVVLVVAATYGLSIMRLAFR